MQQNSFLTDLIQFKDEIFKKLRLLENRLTADITDKFTQSNLIYESVNNRLNLISSNNDALLELLTSQKLNLEKLGEFEKFRNKFENSIITSEFKIKQLTTDVENMRNKIDKIMYENLQVSGCIGPGCQYKSISEYIRDNISEFSKMKIERERLKLENSTIKTKLDNISKSTMSLIDNGIFRCQKYTDRKNADIKSFLDNKIDHINEKNMELRTTINRAELNRGQILDNLIIDVENLKNMKEEFNNMKENKINEINNKIENMTHEIKLLKSPRKEYHSRSSRKMIIGSVKKLPNYIDENGNSILSNKTNEVKSNSNSPKKKFNSPRKEISNNDSNEIIEEKNNSSSIDDKNSKGNNDKLIKNENFVKKRLNNKEEEKIILGDKSSSKNIEKIIPEKLKDNENKKEEEKIVKLVVKENTISEQTTIEKNKIENNKIKKIENNMINKRENNNINNNIKIKENKENKQEKDISLNIKNNISANKANKDILFSEKKQKSENNEKYKSIDLNKNMNSNIKIFKNINNIIEKEKIIVNTPTLKRKTNLKQNLLIKYNNELIPSRIKIKSQEKQKLSLSNGSRSNLTNNQNETDFFKSMNYNINNSNESNTTNFKNNINIKYKFAEKGKEQYLPMFKKFSNLEKFQKIKHKIDTNYKIISQTKSLSYISVKQENKKKINYKMNEEQKQVMDNIKNHFNIMKEKNEQKSMENIVACNVINLHLKKDNNLFKEKRKKNTSAKISLNKYRNNLSEVSMKLSPAFGRTAYNFFIKNHLVQSYEDIKPGSLKANNLKSTLSEAFMASIKEKMYLNDKGNIFT